MMAMVSPKFMTFFTIFLLMSPSSFGKSFHTSSSYKAKKRREELSTSVRSMFSRGYLSYRQHAFPHDELKPITRTGTDSLSGSKSKHGHAPKHSSGTSVTLIESLTSLLIMGYYSQFKDDVLWLSQNLNFDVDARVNLYEWNTRVLGGLVSAHIVATNLLHESYNNELLDLAEDLGRRFLPAFDTPTGLPYAWINLKYGVKNETKRSTTAECGSLILEMGTLSRLTSDTRYESAALGALRKLWSMRSPLDLLGTKLNVITGKWIDHSSGIGTGIDSFYECLVKAHFLFGRDEFWTMFLSAYIAVQRHIRYEDVSFIRYKTVDMRTADEINWQLSSVQAFWPGVQVLIGDIASANLTHRDFVNFWQACRLLPERFSMTYSPVQLTIIERQYPLRPEFAESTFYMYQVTKDPWYLEVGVMILQALSEHTQVDNGYASIKDVITMEKEDHQPGYFLSEMCKYLYLLYNDSFLDTGNYIFTTRGHPLPVTSLGAPERNKPGSNQIKAPENSWASLFQKLEEAKQSSALSNQVCPSFTTITQTKEYMLGTKSACHVLDAHADHRCTKDEECGVDSFTCVPRECSSHGYCGDWYYWNRGVAGGGWMNYDDKNNSVEISVYP